MANLPEAHRLRHAEAFCLMLYRNRETGREEWLWNSRDGVVPFGIPDAEDGGEMMHADWFRDVRAPFFVPPIGSRIFVDMTEENAARKAAQWYERLANDPDCREAFLERCGDREAAIAACAAQMMQPGAPDILVVNAAIQETFRSRAPVLAPQRGTNRFRSGS